MGGPERGLSTWNFSDSWRLEAYDSAVRQLDFLQSSTGRIQNPLPGQTQAKVPHVCLSKKFPVGILGRLPAWPSHVGNSDLPLLTHILSGDFSGGQP